MNTTSTLRINPLTHVLAVTGYAKTHPQFPLSAITGLKKSCEDSCLSYPPWRLFCGSPIVLLLWRTNKPMRMDFLNIFLDHSRDPREMVFCFKILGLKSAGYHGVLQAKSTNFQGLGFVPKMDKLLLAVRTSVDIVLAKLTLFIQTWCCLYKVDFFRSNSILCWQS